MKFFSHCCSSSSNNTPVDNVSPPYHRTRSVTFAANVCMIDAEDISYSSSSSSMSSNRQVDNLSPPDDQAPQPVTFSEEVEDEEEDEDEEIASSSSGSAGQVRCFCKL